MSMQSIRYSIFLSTLMFLFGVGGGLAFSQEDSLLDMLESTMPEPPAEVQATFKSTRIFNLHTIERMRRGDLDFRVAHRFDSIQTGWDEFFGMDEASTQLSVEYGCNDWLMIGLGRATYHKTMNGLVKLSLIRQRTGEKPIPVSVSWYTDVIADTREFEDEARDEDLAPRFSYFHQLLIARKFSPRFSLQIMPSWLHRNLVSDGDEPNDQFIFSLGGRCKLTHRVTLNGEWSHVDGRVSSEIVKSRDPFAISLDIETGSHVFQLAVTNAFAITEDGLFNATTADFWDGEIHIGFNISRVFSLARNRR